MNTVCMRGGMTSQTKKFEQIKNFFFSDIKLTSRSFHLFVKDRVSKVACVHHHNTHLAVTFLFEKEEQLFVFVSLTEI